MSLRQRRRLVPYLLLGPGIAYLAFFFVWPMANMAYVSLESGDIESGYGFSWNFSSYSDAISSYQDQFFRSVWYGAVATVAALLICYPLAYFIAFRAGRFKNLLLLLVILPFFTSYLVRTVAWQNILADQGWIVTTLKDLGIMKQDGRLLATTFAVIAGITYNFLPFMALPLYVSLEKIDRRLVEAAQDLYASKARAFLRVTLPLSLPGIFAGSLLTFIPAVGDFVNAQLLGTSRQYMIGNVIQSKFLVITDYPQAAALAFILSAFILITIFVYARLLGTEELREARI